MQVNHRSEVNVQRFYTKKKEEPEAKYLPLSEIASNFLKQTVNISRRKIALLRRFPGAFVTYKRAATKGPNADSFVIVVKYPDEDVYARMDDLLRRSCGNVEEGG